MTSRGPEVFVSIADGAKRLHMRREIFQSLVERGHIGTIRIPYSLAGYEGEGMALVDLDEVDAFARRFRTTAREPMPDIPCGRRGRTTGGR